MSTRKFVPLGEELADQTAPQFIRTARSGADEDEPPAPTAAVTPAEANDLPGQIRQILQPHLTGAQLDQAATAIATAAAAAPARMALPEIKLTPAAEAETAPGAEAEAPATPPTIELVREENRVTRVIVNCSCGQTIGLDCDY